MEDKLRFRYYEYDRQNISIVDNDLDIFRKDYDNTKSIIDVVGFWGWMECAYHWKKGYEPTNELMDKLLSCPMVHHIIEIKKQGSHSARKWETNKYVIKKMGRCLYFSGYANLDYGKQEIKDNPRGKILTLVTSGRNQILQEIEDTITSMADKLIKLHICVGNYRWKYLEKLVFCGDEFIDQIKTLLV